MSEEADTTLFSSSSSCDMCLHNVTFTRYVNEFTGKLHTRYDVSDGGYSDVPLESES